MDGDRSLQGGSATSAKKWQTPRRVPELQKGLPRATALSPPSPTTVTNFLAEVRVPIHPEQPSKPTSHQCSISDVTVSAAVNGDPTGQETTGPPCKETPLSTST